MTIKSDHWIRRMAQEGMISPFEPGQIRQDATGQKIVSYGTSSYGYDIRCANEFKIFTNINSTIVDPKHFDEKSFVDFHGDVCIIPPTSFALARTVELGQAVYWSRSRKKLWHKGEESGHFQEVQEIRVDCDQDVLLLKVKQVGDIACHTGRHSCFFSKFEHNGDESDWIEVDPVLKNPDDIYK
jgi:hypothetical protein